MIEEMINTRTVVDVFIWWGQSNEFIGNITGEAAFTLNAAPTNCLRYTDFDGEVLPMKFPNMDFLLNGNLYYNKEYSFATEIKRGYYYKWAENGSSLIVGWTPNSVNRNRLWNGASILINYLKKQGFEVRVHFGQDQWEADAGNSYANYTAAMVEFYGDFEEEIHPITSYLFAKPNVNSTSYNQNTEDQIVPAFNDFAASKKYAIVVDYDDIVAGLDSGLHYTGLQNIERGIRMANAWKSFGFNQ